MIKKKKEYYSLIELETKTIVDLKKRALLYRMEYVKEKYKNNNKLLFKSKGKWNIHESIVFEFDRLRRLKKDDRFDYQSLVTISPDGNYCKDALFEVIKDVYIQLEHIKEDLKIQYFIEQGEMGLKYHIHFIVNLSYPYKNVISRASQHYIANNIDVRPVYLERNLIKYLRKEVKAQGYLTSDIVNT
ncbi:hypothetical protein JYT59_01175 [Sphingobacteriaceae bacterium AH-315-L07]|nr:hypothetical protein [Sphingobacteriaceae bacterium AH-315-L07]